MRMPHAFKALTALLAAALLCGPVFAESWEVRMWRQINRKVTLELTDTKLTEACEIIRGITGVTIILDPKLRASDPTLNLNVKEMDAGTVIKWFTILTDTYADVIDQAIYISADKNKQVQEKEKNDLMVFAAEHRVVLEGIPPEGIPLTDQDRVKIAMQIFEKETPKVQDFPGPNVGFDLEKGASFTFPNP